MSVLASNIGGGDAEKITIRGYDLVDDLIDKRDFIDIISLTVLGSMPDDRLKRMINLFLVTAADHGLTPSALSVRLTLLGAPESMQGAVAAGILGAGSRFLGTVEYAARFFRAVASEIGDIENISDSDLDSAAERIVKRERSEGRHIPGLGHPIHVHADPRSAKIIEVAQECGYLGAHCRIAKSLSKAATKLAGKNIPLNAAGAKGAVILDMGLAPEFAKGLTLIGRVAGLVAHAMEEKQNPIAQDIWDMACGNHKM